MKDKLGVPLEGFADYCRYVASQGVVLLKNKNDLLPFNKNEKVSIFGRCQIEYYRSGTGSGGSVSVAYTTNILDSFKNLNMANLELAKIYENWLLDNPFDNGGGGWAAEPWNQKEMPLTAELVQNARETTDKALVIIGRTAGEDKDNLNKEGSYLLTFDEQDMLEKVCDKFENVCVLLNTSSTIDMSWTLKFGDKIKALMYTWNGGMEGANGATDVLVGDITPSGKLPDTIALNIEDYPSTKNHGGKTDNIYSEDIYVGYRYFQTFAKEKVLFPFGFGLSYTSFNTETTTAHFENNNLKFKVTVKNTGDKFSGKEVVQIYLKAPQGKLGKAEKSLVAFSKTDELNPQQTQELELLITPYQMSSYDDSGVTGFKSAYVLEQGEYEFYVGTDVNSAVKAFSFNVEKAYVVEQLSEALAPTQNFDRIKPCFENDKYIEKYEAVPTKTIDLEKRISENLPTEIAFNNEKLITLKNVQEEKHTIEEFVAQLDQQALCTIVRGEGMSHPHVTPGTASAFAGVSNHLRQFGIPLICTADGPSGIRMESGLKSTQVPIGTLLSSTWDTALIEKLYEFEGKEMLQNHVDVLLGPGMNIHRNPLNGRNFEYFSEDPLLTGKIASSIVRGIQKSGSIATLKHFACNSQETYRHDVNSVVSERAVREIYLKAFEIAVKEAGAMSIMTSYNPINGHWTASNYDLNTTILHDEWKFDGVVMTDWWAKMNDTVNGGTASRQDTCSMVKSQNDVYMVVPNFGAETNGYNDNLELSLKSGELTIAELQRSAINICKFAMNSNAMNRDFSLFATPILFKAQQEKENLLALENAECAIEFTDDKYIEFNCKENGLYKFTVVYSSVAKELAQTTCKFTLNNKDLMVIQVNTTKGTASKRVLGTYELEKGSYKLESFCTDTSYNSLKIIIEK
ncbi:MAG: glycoside hydrolase family 3 N-terminal domain-containing protein [Clostridia bacterium]